MVGTSEIMHLRREFAMEASVLDRMNLSVFCPISLTCVAPSWVNSGLLESPHSFHWQDDQQHLAKAPCTKYSVEQASMIPPAATTDKLRAWRQSHRGWSSCCTSRPLTYGALETPSPAPRGWQHAHLDNRLAALLLIHLAPQIFGCLDASCNKNLQPHVTHSRR
jgi:hypothetical protein